jgi:hypothetical protein
MTHPHDAYFPSEFRNGASKREHFTLEIAKSLLSTVGHIGQSPEKVADIAVTYADALLARLRRGNAPE